MSHHPYVAIEGVIGVGKTTLARLLQPELSNSQLILEVFEENPFLSDFYSDRTRYAFQTQIFFLLSRYRQQSSTIPQAIQQGPIVSDYTFAKDRLFAGLNLAGDELAMYERVHSALGEKVPRPDLLVFLRADLDVLMARIAARDRPYERNMDPNYIDELRVAYEKFTQGYDEAPMLVIDTNNLNIVQNPDDLTLVIERIKSTLRYGEYQPQLPGVEGFDPESFLHELEEKPRGLTDFQQFHISLDAEKGFDPDPFLNFIGLSEEIGELARVLKVIWNKQYQLRNEGLSKENAHHQAIQQHHKQIEEELADCLAYLLKLSNYAGIDLEAAYLEKMSINAQRRWKDGQVLREGTD